MKLTASLFFIIWASAVYGQTKLKGYVTIQNTGLALYPAQVFSEDATAVNTDSKNGQFILVYDSKKPGMDVEIRIQSIGNVLYEIVPERSRFSRIPDNASRDSVLRLVVCEKGAWQKNRDNWIKNNELVLKNDYERKIKLQRQKYTTDLKRFFADKSRLELQRDSAIRSCKRLAEDLAMTDLSQASELYKKAVELFISGKIDESITLLDENKLLQSIKKSACAIKTYTKSNAQDIKSLILKAKALAVKLEWKNATRLYKEAIDCDTTNYDNGIEAAQFFRDINDNPSAIRIYSRIAHFAPSTADSVEVRNKLAAVLYAHQEIAKAQIVYSQNLSFYRNMKDTLRFRENLANTLNSLGVIFSKTHDKRSVAYFKESLDLYQKLYEANDSYLEPYIQTINNYAGLLLKTNKFLPAVNYFRQALNARNFNYNKNKSDATAKCLAESYVNLALVQKSTDPDSAALNYRKSLVLYREIVKDKPYLYKADFAKVLSRYANFLIERSDLRQAFEFLKEAISIDQDIKSIDSAAVMPSLVEVYNNLSFYYESVADSLNRIPTMSLMVNERFKKVDSVASSPGITSKTNLYLLEAKLNSFYDISTLTLKKALDNTNYYLNRSLALSNVLYTSDSLYFGEDYAISLVNSSVLIRKSNPNQAIIYNKHAAKIYISLMEKSLSFASDFYESLEYLGTSYYFKGDKDSALFWFRQVVPYYEKSVKINESYYLPKLLFLYQTIADIDVEGILDNDNPAYIQDGKVQVTHMNACLDTLKNNQLTSEYQLNLRENQDFFLTATNADISWFRKINMMLKILDSVQNTLDTSFRTTLVKKLKIQVSLAFNNPSENFSLTARVLSAYHNLSWICLFAKRPELAQRAVESGLKVVPSDENILTNLALAYLYQNEWEKAKAIYLRFKEKKKPDGKTWSVIFINDLIKLKKAGITTSYYTDALSLLSQ